MVKKRHSMAQRRAQPARRIKTQQAKTLFFASQRAQTDASDDQQECDTPNECEQAKYDEAHNEQLLFRRPTRWADHVRQYVWAHRRQGWQSICDLAKRPWAHLLIVLMLGTTLFVPLALYAISQHLGGMGASFDPSPVATVFFESDVEHAQAWEMARQWQTLPSIRSVDVISKAQGMQDLLKSHQLSTGLVQSLGQNPLPEVVRLTLDTEQLDSPEYLQTQLSQAEGVARVVLDALWTERFMRLIVLLEKAGYVLALSLAMVVVLTIANVTRLSIENQRDHIKVAGLFGASKAYLSRPFVYQGVSFGAAGAWVSLVMLLITKVFLSEPLAYLLESYALPSTVLPLTWGMIAGVFLVACGLGAVGALLAVRQVLGKLAN